MGYLPWSRAIMPWLAGVALLLVGEAMAAQQSPASADGTTVSISRLDPMVSACRTEAARRAALADQLHPVRWDETARPKVRRLKSGARAVVQVSIDGWARHGDDWVPIIARCQFDNGRPVVSLDVAPSPVSGQRLDLSGIAPLASDPAEPVATTPTISPPPTDPPATSGSSLAPTLGKTPLEAPPPAYKNQDFLHRHWFGVELQSQF